MSHNLLTHFFNIRQKSDQRIWLKEGQHIEAVDFANESAVSLPEMPMSMCRKKFLRKSTEKFKVFVDVYYRK